MYSDALYSCDCTVRRVRVLNNESQTMWNCLPNDVVHAEY